MSETRIGSPDIEAKLKKLKDYWYNDDFSLKWVDKVEKDIRRMMASKDIAKLPVIKMITDDAKNRISTINKLLVFDENMTTEVRKMLIREKAVHQFYLDRFDGTKLEDRMNRVTSVLDEELTKVGLGD